MKNLIKKLYAIYFLTTAITIAILTTFILVTTTQEGEKKKTNIYTMGGYAVNSVTIETDDWNVWRVRGYDLIDNVYYIVTFDDNGTINVDDDVIIDIREKDS